MNTTTMEIPTMTDQDLVTRMLPALDPSLYFVECGDSQLVCDRSKDGKMIAMLYLYPGEAFPYGVKLTGKDIPRRFSVPESVNRYLTQVPSKNARVRRRMAELRVDEHDVYRAFIRYVGGDDLQMQHLVKRQRKVDAFVRRVQKWVQS